MALPARLPSHQEHLAARVAQLQARASLGSHRNSGTHAAFSQHQGEIRTHGSRGDLDSDRRKTECVHRRSPSFLPSTFMPIPYYIEDTDTGGPFTQQIMVPVPILSPSLTSLQHAVPQITPFSSRFPLLSPPPPLAMTVLGDLGGSVD